MRKDTARDTLAVERVAAPPKLDWDNQTVFKDSVLGYISIPKAVVREIIDHELFQRLHDIAQTGMEVLYPGATHNRFCHSIGVYHLGKSAIENFMQNVKSQYPDAVYHRVGQGSADCEQIWHRWEFLFQMACLLHDCGHSPLSHTLEFVYDAAEDSSLPDALSIESNRLLVEFFGGVEGNFAKCFLPQRAKKSSGAKGAPHERMSACLLTQRDRGYYQQLYDLIRDHMRHYFESAAPSLDKNAQGLYDAFLEQYTPQVYHTDLEFMVRCIIGCPYNSESHFFGSEDGHREVTYQVRNCIIALLNAKIDVDNIDYSIRDASVSGYKSSQVDYERLLKANTIALAYDFRTLRLTGEPFDHSVCLKRLVTEEASEERPVELTLSGDATLLVRWSGDGEHKGFRMTGNISEDDEVTSGKDARVIHLRADANASIELTEGRLEIMPREQDRERGAQLYLRSEGLRGSFTGTVFKGSGELPHWIAEQNSVLQIHPAYHKSALSVIQSALDAANFESLWIYSHHATTYNNNFLSVYLLEKYADFQFQKECRTFFRELREMNQLCGKLPARSGPVRGERGGGTRDSDLFQRAGEELEKWLNRGQTGAPLPDGKQPSRSKALLRSWTEEERGQLARLSRAYAGETPAETGPRALSLLRAAAQAILTINKLKPIRGAEQEMASIEDAARDAYAVGLAALDRDLDKAADGDWEKIACLSRKVPDHAGLAYRGTSMMNRLLGMPTPKQINGKRYYRTSDADLRSMYRSLENNATQRQREEHRGLFDAIRQYTSRCYLRPMWKSHAEFNFYVQGWKRSWFHAEEAQEARNTGDGKTAPEREPTAAAGLSVWAARRRQRNMIQRFFFDENSPREAARPAGNAETVSGGTAVQGDDPIYMLFSDDAVHNYNERLRGFWEQARDTFHIETLVYVPQKIRYKRLEDSGTYVVWKNRIVTLRDIKFQINADAGRDFFYLYYRCAPEHGGAGVDAAAFMKFLKNCISELEKSPVGPEEPWPSEKQAGCPAGPNGAMDDTPGTE